MVLFITDRARENSMRIKRIEFFREYGFPMPVFYVKDGGRPTAVSIEDEIESLGFDPRKEQPFSPKIK